MADYRRNRVPGGTYFFTVNLLDRRSSLLIDQIEALRSAVRRTRELMPFHIDGWVILPEHMHALWTLPDGDSDFPRRWQVIKMLFSRAIPANEPRAARHLERGERGIWQRRYWEHTIRSDQDYMNHLDYIHFNPVKHGLVEDVGDWRFSTFHRSVGMGLYPSEWGGSGDDGADRGERR